MGLDLLLNQWLKHGKLGLGAGLGLVAVLGVMPRAQGQDLPPLPALPPPVVYGEEALPSAAPTGAGRYMVYVSGDSLLLLEQVRQIEPDAFRRVHQGRTVIQTGLFSQEQNARAQASQLAALGLGAEVASVAAMGPPPLPGTSAGHSSLPPAPNADGSISLPVVPVPGGGSAVAAAPGTDPGANRAYYVVIPGRQAELSTVQQQVVSLGMPGANVQSRQSPLGPHVAVGPFEQRGLAEEWNGYLRQVGLNARVHFQP
jgi:hypothetical protein